MGSVNLSRRQVLAALAAGGLLPTFVVSAAGQNPVELRRWKSGNSLLAPLTRVDEQIFFSGDKTVGLIYPRIEQIIWNVPHGLTSEAVFKPRVAGGSVLTGGLKELGAWRVADGKLQWLHKAHIQMGVPFVTPQRTYVGDGHELLALKNLDGSVVWRFAGTPDTLSSYAPVVAGDTVLFGPGNGLLYALSAADGKLKWQLDDSKEWQYTRQLYVSGDTLVAGTYTELLYGISIVTGKILWKFKAGNFINSHHVAGGTAYLWSPTGWVYAIDIANGRVRWRHQTTRYGNSAANWGPMMAELVTFENHLYCLDMNQVLHVLELSEGKEVKRVAFAHGLRPTVLPLPGKQAVVATNAGDIIRVQW
ncbi:MAG: PQQ-binding-like beta-propeller repeat protein [Burkholderiaceae bacterium]